jgi:hypothetical protein
VAMMPTMLPPQHTRGSHSGGLPTSGGVPSALVAAEPYALAAAAPQHVPAPAGVEEAFPPVPLPLLIKDRWKFKSRIGQGSFGAVFSGRDLRTGQRLACKLEPVSSRRSLLKTEVTLLKDLQGECA